MSILSLSAGWYHMLEGLQQFERDLVEGKYRVGKFARRNSGEAHDEAGDGPGDRRETGCVIVRANPGLGVEQATIE